MLAPLGFCWIRGEGGMHIVTMVSLSFLFEEGVLIVDCWGEQYSWIVFRLLQAVDSHSGYDFPWSLNKFLPLWAGAE